MSGENKTWKISEHIWTGTRALPSGRCQLSQGRPGFCSAEHSILGRRVGLSKKPARKLGRRWLGSRYPEQRSSRGRERVRAGRFWAEAEQRPRRQLIRLLVGIHFDRIGFSRKKAETGCECRSVSTWLNCCADGRQGGSKHMFVVEKFPHHSLEIITQLVNEAFRWDPAVSQEKSSASVPGCLVTMYTKGRLDGPPTAAGSNIWMHDELLDWRKHSRSVRLPSAGSLVRVLECTAFVEPGSKGRPRESMRAPVL